MDLSIITVSSGKGNTDEYVLMKASSALDLEFYALCDTTFNAKGQNSNRRRNFYWFPEQVVRQDEYVVLWTKAGQYKRHKDNDGNVFHYFYWGLDGSVWNNKGDKAVLFEINEIDMSSVK